MEPLAPMALGPDRATFETQVKPHVRELQALCYRMSGSLADAEDLLQDSMLRAWRGLDGFHGRSSLRTWLYRVTTNTCINALASSRTRALPAGAEQSGDPNVPPAAPIMDPIWIEPCPPSLYDGHPVGPDATIAQRESVALAFIVALQNLAPKQRAALVLRDVVGMSAAESAQVMECSVEAVNSALQRARAKLESLPHHPGPVDANTPDDPELQKLLQNYLAAWEQGDVGALVSVLHDDATLAMPPVPTWYAGRDTVVQFLSHLFGSGATFRGTSLVAAGAPAYAIWKRTPGSADYQADGLHVLTLQSARIQRLDVFLNPQLFQAFGLPLTIS